MLQYIPAPNTALGFATSSFNQTVRDDKGAVRVDANTRLGLFSAYYFIDDFNLDNPYPVAQSGASVPGFNAVTTGRAQLFALGDTKTFNTTMVNELHLSYMRDNTNLGQPVGGLDVSLVSQGFANADGSPSIVALDPKGQSVENFNFNGYSTGAAANQLIQVNNTYQVTDASRRCWAITPSSSAASFMPTRSMPTPSRNSTAALFSPERKPASILPTS